MEKIINNGKTAVLVSPGYGAGWSTWASSDQRETMCMDARIVQHVLDGNLRKAADAAISIYPDVYTGGAEDLVVRWVPVGELFEIREYDGSESLVIIGQQRYMMA